MLETKSAIVFGGSSGIGAATAKLLVGQGVAVTIVGRDAAKLAAAAKEMDVRTAVADGLDAQAVNAAFDIAGVVEDVVICVSGGKGAGLFKDLNLDDVADAFRQKTLAQLTIAQVAAKRLTERGSITFVTAASPRSVIRGTAGLAAVNGAIEQLIPILALELAPIRVNAVSPGIIDTAWWNGMPSAVKDAFFAQAEATLPVRRVGRPDEVADLIAVIARTGFITGSVMEIDGGSHLVTQ